MSFSMSPPAPKPTPSPAQYQQQHPPPQQPSQQQPAQQQHPQYPPPQYQHPVQQPSPANPSPYPAPPPAKRQRLSPNPRSPPPPYQNGGYHAPPSNLPGGSSYGNPYAPSPTHAQSPYTPNNFAASPQHSFNTPQPYPPQQIPWQSAPNTPAPAVQRAQQQSTGSPQPNSQMMPPPPRPNKEEKDEKGVDDVTDVMHGSGINLKDEENYLQSLYTNRHTAKDSFGTQGSSFGSGTLSGGNSFNMLQGTSFDGQNGNGALAGTLGQPLSQDDVEKEAKRKRELAAREKAERDQHHLNNPFLLGNVLRVRMDKIAKENSVRLDVNGLYLLQQPEPTKVMTNGANTEGIVRAGSKIDQGAPYADILSLVSLAAGERIRGLLDDSHALARARLYGDHNRVPPDLADLAIAPGNERKNETVQPENITGTEWDRLPDAPGGPDDNDAASAKPQHTISFQSSVNNHFRKIAEADRLAEQARIRKREARRKAAEAAAADDDGTGLITADDKAAVIPAPAGPELPKLTKKEQIKQQKEAKNAVEALSSTTTNQTANMMAMGKKSKKYSWMNGPSQHTNRFAKPGSVGGPGGGSGSGSGGTSTPIKKEGARTPTTTEPDDAGIVKWGEWKEDKGVQMRDWVSVLERDGRERKALQKAMNSMK